MRNRFNSPAARAALVNKEVRRGTLASLSENDSWGKRGCSFKVILTLIAFAEYDGTSQMSFSMKA